MNHRVHNSCRPQWTTTFPLTYEYGSACFLIVRVFRVPCNTGSRWKKTGQPAVGGGKVEEGQTEGESLGDAVFEIGDVLGTKHRTKVKRLPKGGV